jgi:MYXO-CTERM domain-containing protein
VAALVAAGLMGTAANADYAGKGGDVLGPWYGGGANLTLGATEDNNNSQLFRELSGVTLPANVIYNAHDVGQYNQLNDLTKISIPHAGASVNTWILHFDPSKANKSSNGYVDFDREIYVISRDIHLSPSDGPLGNPTNTYAGALVDRGYDLGGGDQFSISKPSSGIWRLSFDNQGTFGMDELRVVEVPAPGALALLGLGGLLAARRRR